MSQEVLLKGISTSYNKGKKNIMLHLVHSTQQPLLVRVIRDERDARLDYKLTKQRVETLLASGALLWDMTNKAYCTPRRGELVR